MKRYTIRDIQKMKDNGQAITILTGYDATSARLAEAVNIPLILVGDTLGMVAQGHDSTLLVTEQAFVVGDMPFMSYHISPAQALENAGRLMQEAGVSCVKLEGGAARAETIAHIVNAGIPVMAHIGLPPQSVHRFGGSRVQGRQLASARQRLRDARAVQVFHDILALFDDFVPKHTKHYAEIGEMMRVALQQYRDDVQAHQFPTDANSFSIQDEIIDQLKAEVTDESR